MNYIGKLEEVDATKGTVTVSNDNPFESDMPKWTIQYSLNYYPNNESYYTFDFTNATFDSFYIEKMLQSFEDTIKTLEADDKKIFYEFNPVTIENFSMILHILRNSPDKLSQKVTKEFLEFALAEENLEKIEVKDFLLNCTSNELKKYLDKASMLSKNYNSSQTYIMQNLLQQFTTCELTVNQNRNFFLQITTGNSKKIYLPVFIPDSDIQYEEGSFIILPRNAKCTQQFCENLAGLRADQNPIHIEFEQIDVSNLKEALEHCGFSKQPRLNTRTTIHLLDFILNNKDNKEVKEILKDNFEGNLEFINFVNDALEVYRLKDESDAVAKTKVEQWKKETLQKFTQLSLSGKLELESKQSSPAKSTPSLVKGASSPAKGASSSKEKKSQKEELDLTAGTGVDTGVRQEEPSEEQKQKNKVLSNIHQVELGLFKEAEDEEAQTLIGAFFEFIKNLFFRGGIDDKEVTQILKDINKGKDINEKIDVICQKTKELSPKVKSLSKTRNILDEEEKRLEGFVRDLQEFQNLYEQYRRAPLFSQERREFKDAMDEISSNFYATADINLRYNLGRTFNDAHGVVARADEAKYMGLVLERANRRLNKVRARKVKVYEKALKQDKTNQFNKTQSQIRRANQLVSTVSTVSQERSIG